MKRDARFVYELRFSHHVSYFSINHIADEFVAKCEWPYR
jgi:hypothetical protein